MRTHMQRELRSMLVRSNEKSSDSRYAFMRYKGGNKELVKTVHRS